MITVLIRCSDDFRVFDCITSINNTIKKCPIVVSTTHNLSLEKKLISKGIVHCVVPKCNAAVTNIEGLKLIKTNKVIITDCDTIFEKNTIRLLDIALDKYDVVKTKLVFRSNIMSKKTSPVANLRTFFNDNDERMYIPGFAFNLSIKAKIGGYFFDKNIPWGEDSEFSDRVTKSNLKTKVIKKAILYHPSVGIIHDLADAFLIGSKKNNGNFSIYILVKRLKFFSRLASTHNLLTFLYGLIWYFFFDSGRISSRFTNIKKKLEIISWNILRKTN